MDTFTATIKEYGPRFMADMNEDKETTAAVFGNLAHECGAFATLQEIKPTVKGARGGYGWAQWTGPRRRQFEAFCAKQNLKPSDPEANYAFLLEELRSRPYSYVLDRTAIQHTLYAKTVAFEREYEGAGVKNYKSRYAWARRVLALL